MRNISNPAEEPSKAKQTLTVELATKDEDVLASQRLRFDVFGQEMGARLESGGEGVDRDRFDPFCQHLLVRNATSGEIVGCTRILTDEQAARAGGFYSQTEFDLSNLLPLPGRAIEIGRTCIHRDYRHGATLAILWSGLAAFMASHRYEFMMGCASISMEDGGYQARAIMDRVREKYLAPEAFRVTPRSPLPPLPGDGEIRPHIPPLLKAYLRAGVYVCGEACWDPDFNVADVFVLQDMKHLDARYERHFMQRVQHKDGKHETDKKNL